MCIFWYLEPNTIATVQANIFDCFGASPAIARGPYDISPLSPSLLVYRSWSVDTCFIWCMHALVQVA